MKKISDFLDCRVFYYDGNVSTFKGKKNSIEFLSFLLLCVCVCLCLVLLDDGWRLDLCVWIFIFSWKSPRVPFSLEGKRRRSAFVILSVDSLSQPRAASPSVSYQLRRGWCTSERPQCVAPEYIRINNKRKHIRYSCITLFDEESEIVESLCISAWDSIKRSYSPRWIYC
jgi:hypothetical protein